MAKIGRYANGDKFASKQLTIVHGEKINYATLHGKVVFQLFDYIYNHPNL
jgi:hypothetical protein